MTLEDSSSEEPKGDRIKWTYQPERSTEAGITFSWLQKHTAVRPAKEAANRAVIAFYSPLAYQEQPLADPSVLQESVENSIWEMTKQIIRISKTCDFDLSPMVAALLSSGQIKHPIATPMVMTLATTPDLLLNEASSPEAYQPSEEEIRQAEAGFDSGYDAFN